MQTKITKWSMVVALAVGSLLNAQVGINTNNPKATLEIKSKGNTETTQSFLIKNSNNKELLRILDNGKVGIGTDVPYFALDIQGNNYLESSIQLTRIIDNDAAPGYTANKSRGTANNLLAVKKSDHLGNLSFRGYNGATYKVGAMILSQVDAEDEDIKNDKMIPANLTFRTHNKDTDFPPDPSYAPLPPIRMIIRSNGNIGMGTSSPREQLEVRGNVLINDGIILENKNDNEIMDGGSCAKSGKIVYKDGFFYGCANKIWKRLNN